MQLDILQIAQKLIDELLADSQAGQHRAEGVAMLFRRIQEAHASMQQVPETPAAEAESTNVEG
jgi:hypothetical protein